MKSNGLNLLKSVGAPKSFWESVYAWSLSVGRYIVIGTEIIVLTVFIVKIKISADIETEQQQIDNQVGQLSSMWRTEQTMSQVENQLSIFSYLDAHKTKQAQNLTNIFSLVPASVIVTNVQMDTRGVSVAGISSGYDDLQTLNNSFTNSGFYTNVSVVQLTKESSKYGIAFNLEATFVN